MNKEVKKLYVARDNSGEIWLYYNKPLKSKRKWVGHEIAILPAYMYGEVKWEDKEPTRVYLITEKEYSEYLKYLNSNNLQSSI